MESNDTKNISPVVIHLMRGILYKEEKPLLWESLERLEGPVRDYLQIIGLELGISESDGYAYLKSREDEESTQPRLVTRRRLSYPVSLILALLRRKLAEHESSSGEARLILELSELYDMASAFFPSSNNEVKMLKRMDVHVQRIQELGFIRFLDKEKNKLEVKRILKSFVDAQWLGEFDARLNEYLNHGEGFEGDDDDDA
ncbi:MAG: DUF4194 domain-containing protein [Sphaerochaeta sp.]|nr:DUF4194 domain-containing protein [Sphaerochaeta sp.]